MSAVFKYNNGKKPFKDGVPGGAQKQRLDEIGKNERKEKAAVRDFRANRWSGNEADQAEWVRQWKLFNAMTMLTTKSATGRTETVPALDVLMEKVPSPYSAAGAEPLPEDPPPTQAQWIRWEQLERSWKEQNREFLTWWAGNIGPDGYFSKTMTDSFWIDNVQKLPFLKDPIAVYKHFETRSKALGYLANGIQDEKLRERLRKSLLENQSASDYLTTWFRDWQEYQTISVRKANGEIERISAVDQPELFWTSIEKERGYQMLFYYLKEGTIQLHPSYQKELTRFMNEEDAELECYSQKIERMFQMFTQASVRADFHSKAATDKAKESKAPVGPPPVPKTAKPESGANQAKIPVKVQEVMESLDLANMNKRSRKHLKEGLIAALSTNNTNKPKSTSGSTTVSSGSSSRSSLTSSSTAKGTHNNQCGCNPSKGSVQNCANCLRWLLAQLDSADSSNFEDGASLTAAQARELVANAQKRKAAADAGTTSNKRKANFDVLRVVLRELSGTTMRATDGDMLKESVSAPPLGWYKLDSGADWCAATLDDIGTLISDIRAVDTDLYKAVTASDEELEMVCSGKLNERWPRVTLMNIASRLLSVHALTGAGLDVYFPAKRRNLPHGWYSVDSTTGLLQDVGTQDYYVRPQAQPISAILPTRIQFPVIPSNDFSRIYDNAVPHTSVHMRSLVTTAGGGIEGGHAVVDSLADMSSSSDNTWEDLPQDDSDSASDAGEEGSN